MHVNDWFRNCILVRETETQIMDFMLHNHRHSLCNSLPYFVLCALVNLWLITPAWSNGLDFYTRSQCEFYHAHCSANRPLTPFSLIQWFSASGHHKGLNSISMSVTPTILTRFPYYFIIWWVSWWTLPHYSGVIIFRWLNIILTIFLFYFYEEVCSMWKDF